MQQVPNRNIKFLVCYIFYFVLLFIHASILYDYKLSFQEILIQTIYRYFVAIAPLLITHYAINTTNHKLKYIFFLLFIFIIPYPLYNFFQLRHISEIFHISQDQFFTESNYINQVWKIIPVSIYAFSQLIIFFYCLINISAQVRTKRNLLIGILCFYCALSVTIGLTSRLDTFHILTNPSSTYSALFNTLTSISSLINTTIISTFSFSLYLFLVFLKIEYERNNNYR